MQYWPLSRRNKELMKTLRGMRLFFSCPREKYNKTLFSFLMFSINNQHASHVRYNYISTVDACGVHKLKISNLKHSCDG